MNKKLTLSAVAMLALLSSCYLFFTPTKADSQNTPVKGGLVNQPGVEGVAGKDGVDGSTWYSAAGVPGGGLGRDNDHYIDTETHTIYKKLGGIWHNVANLTGQRGVTGAPGNDGATWYSGMGVPRQEVGANGDFYLDSSTSNVWKKVSGLWEIVVNLTGQAEPPLAGVPGADGATWYTGQGAPANSLGKANDLYFDILTGDVYKNLSGFWDKQCSLKGSNGSPGSDGEAGENTDSSGVTWFSGQGAPAATLGSNGSMYLDISSNNLYRKTTNGWIFTVNMQGGRDGADGVDGTDGTNGEPTGTIGLDGVVWWTGAGEPNTGLGENGHMYLDAATSNIYKKVYGTWIYISNLKGASGSGGYVGADGATWYSSSGVPASSLGANGDMYFDVTTSNIYRKVSGQWQIIANIRGASGVSTPEYVVGLNGSRWWTGNGLPWPETGFNNDMYLDVLSANIYQKTNGVWQYTANIKGSNGSDGGVVGQTGSTWYTGLGSPDALVGRNGDYYLNITTYDLYKKEYSSWNLVVNMRTASANGANGANGTDGAKWFSGTGEPMASMGNNGDYYYDSYGSNVYVKTLGAWSMLANVRGTNGVPGTSSSPGSAGSVWFSGNGAPFDQLGADGDYYFDAIGSRIYKKSGGHWILQSTLLPGSGAPGTNGKSWLVGQGLPSDTIGIEGDYYLNIDTNDLYKKYSTYWTHIANLNNASGAGGTTGADGTRWYSGAGVPSNSLGANGDYYYDLYGCKIYQKTLGVWSIASALSGINGAPGANGSQWLSGYGAPPSDLGANGDYYVNSITKDIYKKENSAWALVVNIGGSATAGSNGADGSRWFSGSGAPSVDLGANGDYYLDTSANKIYRKASGVWAIQTSLESGQGSPGPSGTMWYSGIGVPAASLGSDGDYYLNTATNELYKKAGSAWTLVVNLQGGDNGTSGLNGTDGTRWYSGSGAPSASMGANGDYYYDVVANKIYTKSLGSWSLTTSLQTGTGSPGANGNMWHVGIGAPSNSLGLNGDYYLDKTSGNVYQKSAGIWSIQANLKGTDGTGSSGANGTSGTNGTLWFSGAVDPQNTLGTDGDYYFNTSTISFFKKSNGFWSRVASVPSATGMPGTNGTNGADGVGAAGSDGTTWYSGSGAPVSSLGKNGDHYLDISTSSVWKKNIGSWSVLVNLKGIPGSDGSGGTVGKDGSTWHTGVGAPTAAIGVNGDLYLDTWTTDVYKKTSGVWNKTATLNASAGSGGGSATPEPIAPIWPTDSGLVGYYSFNYGNADDGSVIGNHASLNAATPIAGVSGRGISLLTATSGGFTIPGITANSFRNNFTISFWIYPVATPATTANILTKGTALRLQHYGANMAGNAGDFQLSGTRQGDASFSNIAPVIKKASASDNVWHHVTYSLSNGVGVLTIDNETLPSTNIGSAAELVASLGQAYTFGQGSYYLDEVRLYSRVLKPEEKAGLNTIVSKDTGDVTTSNPVKSIKITPSYVSLYPGKQSLLTIEVEPPEIWRTYPIVVTSSDNTVATTINAAGTTLVSGLKIGTAVLTASCNGLNAVSLVNVSKDPATGSGLYISPAQTVVTLKKGDQRTLTATLVGGEPIDQGSIKWTIDNPAIATLLASEGPSNLLTATGYSGNAVITLTHAKAALSARINVAINSTSRYMTISRNSLIMNMADRTVMSVQIEQGTPTEYNTVTWSVNPTWLATTLGSGGSTTIIPQAAGTGEISASWNGQVVKCALQINESNSLRFKWLGDVQMQPGETRTVPYAVTPANDALTDFLSVPDVVSVTRNTSSSEVVITALAEGATQYTLMMSDWVNKAELPIIVKWKNLINMSRFDEDTITGMIGKVGNEEVTYKYTPPYKGITVTSSNTAVATVTRVASAVAGEGKIVITPKGAGSATITTQVEGLPPHRLYVTYTPAPVVPPTYTSITLSLESYDGESGSYVNGSTVYLESSIEAGGWPLKLKVVARYNTGEIVPANLLTVRWTGTQSITDGYWGPPQATAGTYPTSQGVINVTNQTLWLVGYVGGRTPMDKPQGNITATASVAGLPDASLTRTFVIHRVAIAMD